MVRFVLGLAATALLFGGVGQARADLIDNSTVTILPSSSPAFPGYPQTNAIDLGGNRFVTDYASLGQGAATHLDFAFPIPETFATITYTNRTTSGGPDNVFVGGTFDYVFHYEYIFSNDPTFATNVGIVEVTLPNPGITFLPSVADFQTTTDIPNISAQYLRFQVLGTNGANPGAANFDFFTSTALPEPGTLPLVTLGGVVVGGLGWLRCRKAKVA
jgi:hypothetical protein